MLSARARSFVSSYQQFRPLLVDAAAKIEIELRSLIEESGIAFHAVTARAKKVDSLREKLRRKSYKNPQVDLTDLIGVRVITYFAADVDAVAHYLESRLTISKSKSRDARLELEDDKFGYRSIHLIAKMPSIGGIRNLDGDVRSGWFEIQIRSILDHAWAEIEHETVYKAGVDYPIEVRRRFRAVAGALEVVEHAFSGLASARDSLVDVYKSQYLEQRHLDTPFDVARLIAFLEIHLPARKSLRDGNGDQKVSPSSNKSLVSALSSAGLKSARSLQRALKGKRLIRAVEEFAAEAGVAVNDVSHRATLILALAIQDAQLLDLQYPEFSNDPAVRRLSSLAVSA